MPLVWELTAELTEWLTPAMVRKLNAFAATRGNPVPEDLLACFDPILTDRSRNYEQLIGWLQTQYLDARLPQERRRHFHTLSTFIIDMVGAILRYRHEKNLDYLRLSVPYYRGLRALLEPSQPTWLFSLNHDLCVEVLAAELGMPLTCGFPPSTIEFPQRDPSGKVIGRSTFQLMTRSQVDAREFHFFRDGERGINFVKLHGSLDIFAQREELNYLHLLPRENTAAGWIDALRSANEELIYVENGRRIGITGEIAFADDSGEMQFLRRTILAGQYKFDRRISSNTPPELLEVFRRGLEEATRLVTIGYSLGDAHINAIVLKWIESDGRRRLVVVDPRPRIPPEFAQFENRIERQPMTATDYLNRISGNRLSVAEKGLHIFRRMTRRFRGQRAGRLIRAMRQLNEPR
jgi:hypothetical protein